MQRKKSPSILTPNLIFLQFLLSLTPYLAPIENLDKQHRFLQLLKNFDFFSQKKTITSILPVRLCYSRWFAHTSPAAKYLEKERER